MKSNIYKVPWVYKTVKILVRKKKCHGMNEKLLKDKDYYHIDIP